MWDIDLVYAARCLLLHSLWGLLWLAPLFLTLTTWRPGIGRGGIITGCLLLFSSAWLLHIAADSLGLGF